MNRRKDTTFNPGLQTRKSIFNTKITYFFIYRFIIIRINENRVLMLIGNRKISGMLPHPNF